MKVATVAEMRELDRRATAEFGIPPEILMECAGDSACLVIKKEFGAAAKNFTIVCGGGNNGGDGFVVARKLHSDGASVRVLLLVRREKYSGAAKQNLEIISRMNIPIIETGSADDIKKELGKVDAVVDAIFGTGLDRNVEGIFLEAIKLINKTGKPVFALDIASGINGDTGQKMGDAVRANFTISFGLPKSGNMLYPGYDCCGKLYVASISFPPGMIDSAGLKTDIAIPDPLPERKPDTSKMDYGPIMVIGGAASYFWAPHASAYSFLKSGGGYVYLACPCSIVTSVARKGREIVFQPQAETASGSIAISNKSALINVASRMKMVILGPGISLDAQTQQLARELVEEIDKPLLIDGDGITAVSAHPEIVKARRAPTVLTPHTGEMARIMGLAREEVEANRIVVLREGAIKLNAIIVLKGPHSIIGYPDGRVFINSSGTTGGKAGMATAGAGDVLNGTIAAMYCLGQDIDTAVRSGVFIHGLSGDIAADKKGPDGMTAQDILNNLPYAVRYYRESREQMTENLYGTIFSI